MLRVRKIKTASDKIAVQVVTYTGGRTNVIKHIGSAESEYKAKELKNEARTYIRDNQLQRSLFHEIEVPFTTIEISYGLLYKTLRHRYDEIFKHSSDNLLRDLSIIRIVEPTSKMESLELLESYFGIKHSLEHLYRKLPVSAHWFL